jgi:hypothetical protein
VTTTSSPWEALPVPPSRFSKSKETGKHSQFPFLVRRPDTGNETPACSSRPERCQRSALCFPE